MHSASVAFAPSLDLNTSLVWYSSSLAEFDLTTSRASISSFLASGRFFSSSSPATGWSTATVIFQIFLTGTKKLKNHITQCFLSTLYSDILIFWCFSVVRFKKLCLSVLCYSSVNSPILKGRTTQIPPKHIPSTYISMNTNQIPIDTPLPPDMSQKPQTYPGNSRSQQTKTDANRHKQTPPDTLRHCCQVLFKYVWRCLLGHVVVCWHLDFPGDAWGSFGEYQSGIQGNWGAQMWHCRFYVLYYYLFCRRRNPYWPPE